MRTHNIPSSYRKSEILILPPDLALLSTLIGSNYPCLELICMVPKVFEPLKFDCMNMTRNCSSFTFDPIDITQYWLNIVRADSTTPESPRF